MRDLLNNLNADKMATLCDEINQVFQNTECSNVEATAVLLTSIFSAAQTPDQMRALASLVSFLSPAIMESCLAANNEEKNDTSIN